MYIPIRNLLFTIESGDLWTNGSYLAWLGLHVIHLAFENCNMGKLLLYIFITFLTLSILQISWIKNESRFICMPLLFELFTLLVVGFDRRLCRYRTRTELLAACRDSGRIISQIVEWVFDVLREFTIGLLLGCTDWKGTNCKVYATEAV
ncbi:uncharacterized protein F4822DRAFT_383633 [Hypoxylon trugodes]|uniref:uncharacterized protein n=1 Tax=Hypoxylon trugodes TaxID=326681 RepID=UPI002190BF82|nr:uncharacterized protein F4822DRAFT_383633 [Hypoxylon trugodes]KAI1393129.1 hypothetical protein F4822DRAFT_383633 [Hypoxylon trugodes]